MHIIIALYLAIIIMAAKAYRLKRLLKNCNQVYLSLSDSSWICISIRIYFFIISIIIC